MSRFSRIVVVVVCSVTLWSAPAIPCRAEQNDDLIRAALEAEIEKQKTEQLRLELRREVVRLAEQRRDDAKREIDKATQERDRLRQIVYAKEWAIQWFDGMPQPGAPIGAGTASGNFTKYLRLQELQREKFVKFPELSKGEIKSGKALNFFLDACGSAAVKQQQMAAMKLEELENVIQEEVNKGLSPHDLDVKAAAKQLHAIFGGLGNNATSQFDVDEISSIHVEKGLLGPKLINRLNDEPLPLEWPTAIRLARDKVKYESLTKRIERAKETCLDELRKVEGKRATGLGISPESQLELMHSVDRLCAEFQYETEQMIEGLRNPGRVVAYAMTADQRVQRVVAMRYLQSLRNGVTRFIEARKLADVQAIDFPPPNQSAVGIREVLAYMSRHQYRFAEGDINDELVYQRLYDGMREYYNDQFKIKFSVDREQTAIARKENEIRDAKQIASESIDPVSKNELLLEGIKAGQAFFEYMRAKEERQGKDGSPP